ncbi:CoA-substrate-specific enzyme activase, putative [Anaerosphaera aminiphila DSM 21120]|uniref:CoA-substrate-specific enzyme activase, putative n=1 Tax=Anaerosphaera aminiphila DSM 21120 TaxID=1120995 RepID=A0A1M5UCU6_9FIRM|nr:acyl-CoA dehydratase activase [Anaerosphaera aminiphila]SHH60728.1 CoA-substrate-specific enzyme activase, putative [Anaerosphaera aminiphila DSM 21120]
MVDNIYTMGVDIGSTASKGVILEDGKKVIATAVVDVGAGTSGPSRVIKMVLENANLKIEDIKFIMATGYGRNSLEEADFQMSELSCHAKGAYFLFPNVHTIIDIGGQDAKALKIGDGGILENFVMNDKCAAGTGRFLDVIARVLEVGVGDLEALDAKATKDVTISSTCTVFAESEVISQLAKGTKIEDIVKGIHYSIASRVGSLAKRVGLKDDVVFTGGVALNKGMVRALEANLGYKVHTSPMCQLNGALGAALFGYQKYKTALRKEKVAN